MATQNRRHFMALTLGAAGVGSLAALGFRPRSPSDASKVIGAQGLGALKKVQRKGHAFGTEVVITVFHEERFQADQAVTAAFNELELVESLMSLYRRDSQVCRLNRQKVLKDPHPYLIEVLENAQAMAERSNGAFDVTVQPFWSTYYRAQERGVLPSEREIHAAREKVGWRGLKVSQRQVELTMPGMAVTLNGIAQGYAADRVLDALRKHRVTHAMVNTGEVGTLGHKDAGHRSDWRVGIQHPRAEEALIALAGLHGGCMATSGDYATTFSPDRKHHHIFDPRTGDSPQTFSGITVVAPRGVDADALSTAAFVSGIEGARKLVEGMPGAEAVFICKDGSMLATSGFPFAS